MYVSLWSSLGPALILYLLRGLNIVWLRFSDGALSCTCHDTRKMIARRWLRPCAIFHSFAPRPGHYRSSEWRNCFAALRPNPGNNWYDAARAQNSRGKPRNSRHHYRRRKWPRLGISSIRSVRICRSALIYHRSPGNTEQVICEELRIAWWYNYWQKFFVLDY